MFPTIVNRVFVLVMVDIIVIKHHDKKQLGEESVYSTHIAIYKSSKS